MEKFPCERCGQCCRRISGIPLYEDLDRGDGVCKHFNEKTNTCNIYENRPDKCRIDKMYEKYFFKQYSKSEFYRLNKEFCRKWQNEAKSNLKN